MRADSMYMFMYMKGSAMSDRHSIAQARSNLPRLVREAEQGKAVELTRRGEPVAVLIGCREFERLTGRYRSFDETYRAFREAVGLEGLAIDPEVVFAGARDPGPGREVGLKP
jgi:prevent-host-death family protein